jgi:hypothetical protein
MNQSSMSAVYSRSRIPGISYMNVHEVVLKLQQVGITPDTVILVYHVSAMDLSLLREFLESAGYTDILPPSGNCIPLIPLPRMNLSEGPPGWKSFPLGLEELFPVMYRRHQLIGLNHQALIDCQQTRLVCMAFDELCKPIGERSMEWQPDTVASSAQTSILDWLKGSRAVDNDKGEVFAFQDNNC